MYFFLSKHSKAIEKKKFQQNSKKKNSDSDSVKRELKLWYVLVIRNFSMTFQKLFNVFFKIVLFTVYLIKYNSDSVFEFLIYFVFFNENRKNFWFEIVIVWTVWTNSLLMKFRVHWCSVFRKFEIWWTKSTEIIRN